jgi:hypothetical protein
MALEGAGDAFSEKYRLMKKTAEECQNLNALFGVAYREGQRFSVPQLGYLGYQWTK